MALWLSGGMQLVMQFWSYKAADVNESHPMKWMISWQFCFCLLRCIWSSSNGIMKEWSKKSFKHNLTIWDCIWASLKPPFFPKYIHPQIQSVFVWYVVCIMFFLQLPWHTSFFCFFSLRSLSTAKKSWAPPDRVSGFKKRGIDGTSDLKLMADWREDFINASCLCIF